MSSESSRSLWSLRVRGLSGTPASRPLPPPPPAPGVARSFSRDAVGRQGAQVVEAARAASAPAAGVNEAAVAGHHNVGITSAVESPSSRGRAAALLDLDYSEDSTAEVDANVVMTGDGGLVEVQATAERTPLSRASLDDLLALAADGIAELRATQEQAVAAAAAG